MRLKMDNEYRQKVPLKKTYQYSDSTWSAKLVYKRRSIWGYGMTEEAAIKNARESLKALREAEGETD